MKKLILLVAVAAAVIVVAIGMRGPASMALNEADWVTDLPKALDTAKTEKKLIYMNFTGSDWCPACKQLDKSVLATADFDQYAKKNLVRVLVDFPEGKPQPADLKAANQKLAEKFHIEGYPTVIVLDANGKELERQLGYEGTKPAEYIANLDKLKIKASLESVKS